MSRRTLFLITVVFCLVVLSITQVLAAREHIHPTDEVDSHHYEKEMRLRSMEEGERDRPDRRNHPDSVTKGSRPVYPKVVNTLLATGGPDDFGYTWDDAVPYSWETASTNSGITGDDDYDLVSIGFPFKFYEQVWNDVYVTTNGILIFGDADSGCCGGFDFPSPAYPNNVIAPFSVDLTVGEDYNAGGIYLQNGGTTPNRYFVVEWRDVTEYGDDWGDTYTFQVILHENGDIVFQYQTVSDSWWYTIGIEDSYGLDGLSYPYGVYDFDTIRFYRPEPAVRVAVSPLYQSSFHSPGEESDFEILIRNTGEFGVDTYNLTTISGWPMTLYANDGTTPLTDTNMDSIIDTGSIGQGGNTTIIARIETPGSAVIGDNNQSLVTTTSVLDNTKSKTATIQAAVPAPFAQVYQDEADGAMSLYLAQPLTQTVKKASPDWYWGYDLAVAETPGFAYVWSNIYGGDYHWVSDIEFTLLDGNGDTVRTITKLTDHGTATMETHDWYPTVAVAPNGNIGVIWRRYLYNNSTELENINIWFAILSPTGEVISGPQNITNNTIWGYWHDPGWTDYDQPVIAATSDNRFVLSWTEDYWDISGWSVDNIFYRIIDSTGGDIKVNTQLTNASPEVSWYHDDSNLTPLSGDRSLLVWQCQYDETAYLDICYVVMDSSGNILKNKTNVSNFPGDCFNPDAVQLAGGNILITWDQWDGLNQIAYAVLDEAYNFLAGPNTLDNPAGSTWNTLPSVAAAGDRAVITWTDWDYGENLYYALVNSDGSVLTEPMIFLTSQDEYYPYIYTSYSGYGNTSYTLHNEAYLPLVIR